MPGIVTLLSNLFGAVQAAFGYQAKRSDLKNAEDVKVAAKAQNEVGAVDKIEQNIQKKDLAASQIDIAE